MHVTKKTDIKIIQVETQNQCSEFCTASLANAFLQYVGGIKATKWCV